MFNNIIRFLFVKRCFLCGKIISFPDNADLPTRACKSCLDNIRLTNYTPIINFSAIKKGKRYFSMAYAPFFYTLSIKQAILRFKFRNQKNLSAFFAKFMCVAFMDNDFLKDIDYMIPVPISKDKMKRRGYNQSLELAKDIELDKNIEILDKVLIKTKVNKTQSNMLNIKEKVSNVSGVYKVVSNEKIKDKKILLIDDIVTTGATANECAKALIDAGAKEVLLLVIATAGFSKRKPS
ncbi:MAG: ComF family protein [Clostridia bacterium]